MNVKSGDTVKDIYAVYIAALLSTEGKRQTANQVYFSLCLALITAFSTVPGFSSVIAAALLLFISIIWISTISLYRGLSKAKFDVIEELEALLPVKPFSSEWEKVSSSQRLIGLARLEMFAPLVMMALSVVIYMGFL